MASPHNIYESETGNALTNTMPSPQNQILNKDALTWWESDSQPCNPSASSSVYSTSSEKGLVHDHDHVLSSPATSVCVSASMSNGPSFPDLEEEIRMQLDGRRAAGETGVCDSGGTMQTLDYNHEQGQQQDQRKQESTCSNSERWSQYSSASTASSSSSFSPRGKSKTRNQLRRLHSHSESHSCAQFQPLEQESSVSASITNESKKTNLSDEIIRDLRTDIVEKMGILEGKVDALSFSRTFTPQPRIKEEKKVDIGIQANFNNIKPQENEQDKRVSSQIRLEEKITHLSNANANLSSLNALISSDLYSLQETVQELQEQVCSLRDENSSLERRHGSYEEQKVQIELQTDIIRRLGILLGRREEQLVSERRMMKLYKDRIDGLEDKLEMLRIECESVLPLVMSRDKGPILTTVEIDKNK